MEMTPTLCTISQWEDVSHGMKNIADGNAREILDDLLFGVVIVTYTLIYRWFIYRSEGLRSYLRSIQYIVICGPKATGVISGVRYGPKYSK